MTSTSGRFVELARDWIADSQNSYDYEDARDIVNHWSPERVIRTMDEHYDGGYRSFISCNSNEVFAGPFPAKDYTSSVYQ